MEYVLKGSAREFKGDVCKTCVEGDSVLADRNTTRWWRNHGTEPAIFAAVDIFNPTQ